MPSTFAVTWKKKKKAAVGLTCVTSSFQFFLAQMEPEEQPCREDILRGTTREASSQKCESGSLDWDRVIVESKKSGANYHVKIYTLWDHIIPWLFLLWVIQAKQIKKCTLLSTNVCLKILNCTLVSFFSTKLSGLFPVSPQKTKNWVLESVFFWNM